MDAQQGRTDAVEGQATSQASGKITDEEIRRLPINKLLERLGSSRQGLTSEQVERHLELYGHNELAKKKRRTPIIKFLLYLRNPLVLILLFAGSISALLGDPTAAIIIFLMVLASVVMTFVQETRAENAAEELKKRVATTATLLRGGVKMEIALSEVVPGDIAFLSAGDLVPADARLISAKDLFVLQAALTGESFPVEKTIDPPKSEATSPTEWNNYLFMGTSIITGTATAIVVKTGSSTEYGNIVKKIVERRPETEFERGLRRFGYLIMEVTFLLVIFVFFTNALFKRSVLESLLFSVALAVGLTPELLPMILTVNLSKGAIDMAKKGVIVKRLASIQNFGSMNILCSDKTGTLTENRVTLILHVDMDGNDNEKVFLYSFLNSYYQTGLRSPLDEAILKHQEVNVNDCRKIDEVPFDFVRKRISVVVEQLRELIFTTKGAPEEIAKVCSFYEKGGVLFDLTDGVQRKIERKYHELSSQGFRVLGVAYKNIPESKSVYSVNDEVDMVFLGFVAFMDPPKATAKESLQMLAKSGVELKILTGDNELVTKKVCEELGFPIKRVVLGNEISKMSDDALARVVQEANIFARVTPVQKDRIMSALRSNGNVVGFLGDGVNDAPSMRVADVSISVNNAVDVAKESADIILLETDLRVLQEGVLDGRKTFGNSMKYIMMGISSNFGNMFSAAGASLFLTFLPILPTQILLNNLLYDTSELTIPTDNVDQEYVQKPRRLDMHLIRDFMLFFGPISSLFDFLTFFVMIYVFNATEALFQTAWFIESLATQTLVIFAIRTRRTPFFKSRPSKTLFIGSVSAVSLALILPFTPLGEFFEFVRPPFTFLLILAGFVASYITLVEILKIVFYRRRSSGNNGFG